MGFNPTTKTGCYPLVENRSFAGFYEESVIEIAVKTSIDRLKKH
jgi:hypothetical protein